MMSRQLQCILYRVSSSCVLYNFCTGDKPLSFVMVYSCIVKVPCTFFSSFKYLTFQAALIIHFMDLTAASALPLLCG